MELIKTKPSGDEKNAKFRKLYCTVDYTKSIVSSLNIINLKFWDKDTKTTSNKGLKAEYYRKMYDDDKNKWTFGGIKIEDIKIMCKNNGLKLDKQQTKTYKYGDYAYWLWKTLE